MTTAELARDATADALTIGADSDRSYSAKATATAGGGKDEPTSNNSESTQTLTKTSAAQQGTNGADPKDTSKAAGGKISVAAAAGVVAAQDSASALLDGVSVTLVHDLDLDATNETHIQTLGSGAAVGGKPGSNANIGIGVGVALSIDNNTTTASIADSAHVASAGAVGVKAASYENVDKTTGDSDFAHAVAPDSDTLGVGAEAYAGAASTKVSVAGALAVEYSTATTTASIGDNVTIGASGIGNSVGAVNVETDNTSSFSSLASSKATQGKVGVGASIAVDYSANDSYGARSAPGMSSVYANGVSGRDDQPQGHLRYRRTSAFPRSTI